MATAQKGLREVKRDRTRMAIDRAAVEVVHELGYHAASVDAICERAGVSPRTFFNYAGSKDAAIVGAAAPSLKDHDITALAEGDGDLIEETIALIEEVRAARGVDPEVTHKRREIVRRTPELTDALFAHTREIGEVIRDAVASRLARDRGVDVEDATVVDDSRMFVHLIVALTKFAGDCVVDGADEGQVGELMRSGRTSVRRLLSDM